MPGTPHESLEDAIRSVCHAAGGAKSVAAQLWPEKAPDAAHRLLLNCLNEDRQERLSPGHLMLVLRLGREAGCHDAAEFLAAACGYRVEAITEDDELLELRRTVAQLSTVLESVAGSVLGLQGRLDALRSTGTSVRRVA